MKNSGAIEQQVHFKQSVEDLINGAIDMEERGNLVAAVVLAVEAARALGECPADDRSSIDFEQWCALRQSQILDYLNERGQWEAVSVRTDAVGYRMNNSAVRNFIGGLAAYCAHRSKRISHSRAMSVLMRAENAEAVDEMLHREWSGR